MEFEEIITEEQEEVEDNIMILTEESVVDDLSIESLIVFDAVEEIIISTGKIEKNVAIA